MTEQTEGVGVPTPLDRTDGPDHRAEPVNELTPAKAFWRTVLQVGPLALLALVGILPEIIQVTVEGFGQHLPENFRVLLLGIASAITLTAAWAARIMALPRVQDWFRTYAPFFSVTKK
jgi:hypothetical protein